MSTNHSTIITQFREVLATVDPATLTRADRAAVLDLLDRALAASRA